MRRVIRGYARGKQGDLVLIGTIPFRIAKTNSLRVNVRTKDIWSGEAQRYLRK
jgi:hypothetical protein